MEQEELLDYLQAADIYVTPYLNPAQITSGTLSYAVGMGKAIVSTPYVQAVEILGDDLGVLVPFGDAGAAAEAIMQLLADPARRRRHEMAAYTLGRKMIWSELARNVRNLLQQARAAEPTRLVPRRTYALLTPDASAVLRMSDSTGIYQHSILAIPDRNHGYCIDDNARALILMCQMPQIDATVRDRWVTTYASFLQHGWNPDRNCFRNFMSFDRRWCEEEGSEDSNGRAIWGLGVMARDATGERYRKWAVQMFARAVPVWTKLHSPRAQAFLVLGAAAILSVQPGNADARAMIETIGPRLHRLVQESRRPDWTWFEAVLAYDNARLPQALLLAGAHLGDAALLDCGFATLDWIVGMQQSPDGRFRAVGTESFGRPYGTPLPFDQQPLEAHATVEAAEVAWGISGDPKWLHVAYNSYRWFLGQNDLSVVLATPEDGGCFDGLTPNGANENQGAESLLALQLASCAMNRLATKRPVVTNGNHDVMEQVQA